MLEIIEYNEKFDDDIMKLDELMFLEIKYHADVLKETICIALYNNEFAGVGFLIAGATFLQIEKQELPYYHLHAEYKAVVGTDYEVEASTEMLENLKLKFCRLQDTYFDKRLILRLWCGGSESAYMEFLLYHQFRAMKVTPILVKSLDDSGKKHELGIDEFLFRLDKEMKIQEIKPNEDPELMKSYMEANGSAFCVEDSENELRFRLGSPKSHVFAVMKGSQVIASVTTWEVSEKRAATENIFCIEKYRNRGVTTALLEYVFNYLHGNGYREASLTVFGDNQPALQLYFKLGYELLATLVEMHYETDYEPVMF